MRKILAVLLAALFAFGGIGPPIGGPVGVAEAACTNTTNMTLCKPARGDANWDTSLNNNFDTIDKGQFGAGTAAAPGVSSVSYTTTGLFWAAGPVLGFTVNAAEVGRFTTATFLLPNGSVSAPPLSFSVAAKGFYHSGSGTLGFTSNGNNNINFGAGTIEVEGDGTIGFSATATDATAAFDTAISRVGAAVFGFGSNSGANVKWSLDASTTTMKIRNAANNADAPITAGAGTFSGGLQTSSASTPIGYATGAGGAVTQLTSKSTGVTLNTTTGQITTTADALAGSTTVSFVLTDSSISAVDVLVLNHVSGGTAGAYTLNAQAAAGSASISVRNVTAGSLSEAIVIGFAVMKGRTS